MTAPAKCTEEDRRMMATFPWRGDLTALIRTAHALARAHGHEWAVVLGAPQACRAAQQACLVAQHAGPAGIRAAVAAVQCQCPDIPGVVTDPCTWCRGGFGIMAPEVDREDGHIRHTTGTGRLTWDVAPWGAVEITVQRPRPGNDPTGPRQPGVVVLRAAVSPGGTTAGTIVQGAYEERHVIALHVALCALMPREAADLAVAGLLPGGMGAVRARWDAEASVAHAAEALDAREGA